MLDPADMPVLGEKVGHDIVTGERGHAAGRRRQGRGGRDRRRRRLPRRPPELPRPTLRVGFTPDEEIGKGAFRLDLERFGASCAYTLDGSQPGELQDETFSAREVVLTVHGVDIHPGWATGKLVNALTVAGRILAALPADRLTPTTTSGREGFIHVTDVHGTAPRAVVHAIVRDFDEELLEQHVALLRRSAEDVVAGEPGARLEVEVRYQYSNMRRYLERFPEVVAAAEQAIVAEGLPVVRTPIRGGTDGSILPSGDCPRPTSSPAATSTTPCASGRRCRTWRRRLRSSFGWPRGTLRLGGNVGCQSPRGVSWKVA